MLTCYLLKESAEHWEENYCSGSCLSSFRFFCKGFKHSVMMAWCLTFFKTLAQTQDCLAVPKTQWKSSFFTPPVEVEVKPLMMQLGIDCDHSFQQVFYSGAPSLPQALLRGRVLFAASFWPRSSKINLWLVSQLGWIGSCDLKKNHAICWAYTQYMFLYR